MKNRRLVLFLLVCMVAVRLFTPTMPAQAQSISSWCSLMLGGISGIAGSLTLGSGDFYAGETVMFSATGGSGTLQIEVLSGTIVASGPSPVSYTFPSDISGSFRFADSVDATINYTVMCFPNSPAEVEDDSDGLVAGPPCGAALDGRLNNSILLDCAPPLAIYQDDVGFVLYGIDPETGKGTYLLRVDKADIGDTPAQNTLLGEAANPSTGQPITLWHLDSGELQVNATYGDGKAYIFIFDRDGHLITHYAA